MHTVPGVDKSVARKRGGWLATNCLMHAETLFIKRVLHMLQIHCRCQSHTPPYHTHIDYSPSLHPPSPLCRVPALLQCVLSISATPGLALVLGDLPSNTTGSSSADADMADGNSSASRHQNGQQLPAWAVQQCGGRLLSHVFSCLGVPKCSAAVKSCVLDIVEQLLDGSEEEGALLTAVLQPRLDELLGALKAVVVAAWEGKGAERVSGLPLLESV